jgi:arginyl-tRNA synthetase
MFKDKVFALLAQAGVNQRTAQKLLEVPKDPALGDYSLPCHFLAKEHKKSPAEIALMLKNTITPTPPIEKIVAVGAYLNFYIDKNSLGELVVKNILEQGSLYAAGKPRHETIMIEYPAPNTNKPLHLGHARNILLGNSLCNILGFAGFKVIPVDLVNDRGIHICKSMLAYKLWGEGKAPDKKTDHFVGDYYVLYSRKEAQNPEIIEKVKELLRKWEEGDPETIELWHKLRGWAIEGFKKTYIELGVFHKKTYFESEIYSQGRQLVLQGLKAGLFYKDEAGAVLADLEKYGLGNKVLLRADGTSIYITQDLYLAKLKFDEFHMERSIHIVGNEQVHHFKVLFKLLEMLKMPFAGKCFHLSYGMISLPQGRMKSREGSTVDADDLLIELNKLAESEVKSRHAGLSTGEIGRRSRQISLAALKFHILKYDAAKDFTYKQEESISFEGETGPYVQYAHARICSVFRQAKRLSPKEPGKLGFTHESEFRIITLLSKYPAIVEEAALKYSPSLVAKYALDLSQAFSKFYSECPVLKAGKDSKESRLALIHAVRIVLQSSLSLLGIEAPEEM